MFHLVLEIVEKVAFYALDYSPFLVVISSLLMLLAALRPLNCLPMFQATVIVMLLAYSRRIDC